ncbi:hypothetical protein VN97_g7610, partial [Penicillium thymicola]
EGHVATRVPMYETSTSLRSMQLHTQIKRGFLVSVLQQVATHLGIIVHLSSPTEYMGGVYPLLFNCRTSHLSSRNYLYTQ